MTNGIAFKINDMLLACECDRPELVTTQRPNFDGTVDFKGKYAHGRGREAELHSIYLENMCLHVFVFKFKKKKKTINK